MRARAGTPRFAALALAAILPFHASAEPLAITVTAAAETAGVRGDVDDPAIWVDPVDPARSLILGTDKRGGLLVHGLDGALRARFDDGSLNNVDLRPFRLGGRDVALVGATRRNDDTVALYVIDDGPEGPVVRRAVPPRLPAGVPGARLIYGFAMGQDARGTYAIANFKTGHVVQWRVAERDGRIAFDLPRIWRVRSQPEGMVADDAAGHLYVGEEDRGIWRYPLSPDAAPVATQVAAIPSDCLPRDDVEGLAIMEGDGARFLLASAQGIDRAAVFRLAGEALPTCEALAEVAAGAVDAVTETDGLDVTAASLPGFPGGLLVMMDDGNEDRTTNFKLIPWEGIAAALPD